MKPSPTDNAKAALPTAVRQFAPVKYPELWPPPDLPPYPQHWSSRIPLIGYVSRHVQRQKQWWAHFGSVLEPIADGIVNQLIDRPSELVWPENEPGRSIAQIISNAIADEKGLPQSPALHPDDPFQPLFWGPFDDLTPLIVGMECRAKLGMTLPKEIFDDAWNQRWTIKQFIETATLSLPSASQPAG